jgi:hypothetical protein
MGRSPSSGSRHRRHLLDSARLRNLFWVLKFTKAVLIEPNRVGVSRTLLCLRRGTDSVPRKVNFIFIRKKRGDGQNQRMNNSKCDTPSSKCAVLLPRMCIEHKSSRVRQEVTKCVGKYVDSSNTADGTGLYV